MKQSYFSRTTLVFLLGIAQVLLQSCSKDAESQDLAQEVQLETAELKTIMETDQWTGAADEILTVLFQKSSNSDGKFADEACYEATYTDTGYSVVFGNCLLNGTDNVNGTLEVTYGAGEAGTRSFTAVYNSFFVGNAELNGTRTYSLSEPGEIGFKFSVVSDMKVALSGEEIILENGSKEIEFQFGDTLLDATFQITGSWMVEADGNTYSVTVKEPLAGSIGCPYLTSGQMDVIKNGFGITVDFGDGSCDSLITLIYPSGATREINL
jgi:hypothetical protein